MAKTAIGAAQVELPFSNAMREFDARDRDGSACE